MPVTKAQFKKIALSFPAASEKPSYGNPAIFIAKKFFTRLRAEDNSLVLIVDSIDEREMMMEVDPKTFHITDHYKDYPAVLVRMERVDAKTVRNMLERRWRAIAPKKLLKEMELSSPARGGGAERAKRSQAEGGTKRNPSPRAR